VSNIWYYFKQDRQCTHNVTLRRVCTTIVVVEIHITHSECMFLTLCIQHAMGMRRIILSSVACLALPYFPPLSHIRLCFRGEKRAVEPKMCFFYNFCLKNYLTLRRTERGVIKYGIMVSMKSTRYFCQILIKLEFSGQRVEKYSNIKFHENSSSGSRVVCENGLTDMTKLIVSFLNFSKTPKN
jgi:hypothetical protein